jgi:L-lactate dehydrogenase (cytochrome)/(S)-mandelate dehydrogenase
MRELARAALPRPVFDFADGGAEDERTLRRNESAFDEVELLPRPLDGAGTRHLAVDLFGHRLSLPVIVGPTGLAGLFWPNGECCAARAAAAAGTAICLSHGSVCTLEAFAATGAPPRWMQVFVYRDRGFTRELAERAARAGFDALVLTTDNQLLGNRERDIRNGFAIPPRFRAADLAGMVLKLPWLWRMRAELPRITFGNYVRPGETADIKVLAGRMASLLDPAMSWADVDALRRIWTGPLLLKGVLHPAEARAALDRGIDGLIVSNHGGRQLDGAPASFDALPAVIEAVGGRIPVLLDGGVRRGADVVKALALGAKACLVGRPQLWGLAVAGEAGVAHVLDIYRREIDRVMALCGVSRIADLGPDLIFSRPRLGGMLTN